MKQAERYFLKRIGELKSLAKRGDPWVFQSASSFVEYLAKMYIGKTTTAKDYKDFLRDVFFKACPEYATFTYASGKADLDVQMYHVLRSGIVHSFSLIADNQARKANGRDRSILLAHRKNGAAHLSPVVDGRHRPKLDAVIFAEDFVDDIETVTKYLFKLSRERSVAGKNLRANIATWLTAHPPIGVVKSIRVKS